MALRYLSIILLALLLASGYSQEATPNIVTTDAPATPPPTPQPAPTQNAQPASTTSTTVEPTPAATSQAPAAAPAAAAASTADATFAAQAASDYMERIQKIREEVAKSSNLDHKYLEQKIQQVIASMTPQQKDQFEQRLNTEARAAYQKFKKQQEQQAKREREEEERLKQQAALKEEPTASQKILKEEAKQLNRRSKEIFDGRNFTDFQFELATSSSQDFQFTLPIDQTVALFVKVYSNSDGVFQPISNIENEEPVWLYIYEDNDRLIEQLKFYSTTGVTFQGRANSSYLMRFVNHGSSRLITLYMGHILLHAHIGNKLVAEDVADHKARVSTIRKDFITRMGERREKIMLQIENDKSLLKGFDHYYFYNIGEIVLLGIICVIQVESIRKLLVSTSVV